MTPGRGEGANTALRDAALLRTRLVDVAARGRSVADAKADYEQEMLRYGFEAVDGSKRPYFVEAMMAARGRPGAPRGEHQEEP
jgi:2-polyprenyl-6-methoxyphenol hydroxylase-like FAD-dependent oxidoreductase